MPLVSVILPVYNGEKCVNNTINSILSQNALDFELIVVDDGSSDRSSLIVETHAMGDKRVRLIKQENKGICEARNVGIKAAKSQYLMFCDHDDIFLPGYIDRAYEDISKNGVDFVKYSCEELYLDKDKIYRDNICLLDNKKYCGDKVKEILLQYSKYNEYIWDGIYKKELIEKVGMFDSWYRAGCEDIDLMLKIIRKADSCMTASKVYYEHYIRNASSISRKFNENTYQAVLKTYQYRLDTVGGKDERLYEYINDKSCQLLWALIGMFSFANCGLSVTEMSNRIISLRKYKGFRTLKGNNQPMKIKLVTGLFNMRTYRMLAVICFAKRKLTKWQNGS